MFQEFPKCLYRAGDVEAETRIVLDKAGEAEARKDGFSSPGESQEKVKPQRRPKAEK